MVIFTKGGINIKKDSKSIFEASMGNIFYLMVIFTNGYFDIKKDNPIAE